MSHKRLTTDLAACCGAIKRAAPRTSEGGASQLPYVAFGDSSKERVGDWVVAVAPRVIAVSHRSPRALEAG